MGLNPRQASITGKVIIAGAGPGDAELITLKAVRHLNKADIVLTDRLVNPEIITLHAPQAVVIPVGKQCRKMKSTPQATINDLMVHHALAGRYVVRLKGGDVSIFSNILDELESLIANQIPYEIIPGITAALGTAASAGVPLTARGLSKGVRILTYYNASAINDGDWENMAQTDDTLIFYMSGETCFDLVAALINFGKDPGIPILLAEQATTAGEIFSLSTLGQCASDWHERTFISPALLIIGKVATCYNKFVWHNAINSAAPFFEELENVYAIHNQQVLPPKKIHETA